MDKQWILCLSVILLSLAQAQYALATGCVITSISSPSASSLQVVWVPTTNATQYLLDVRVVNSTSSAPVVLTSVLNNRKVQGLRPGCLYKVTVNAFRSFTVLCRSMKMSWTVPARSKLTLSEAISSTSIKFNWTAVTGANEYYLVVLDYKTTVQIFNQSFTTTSGQVDGLTPSTTYRCYVYSSNSAGMGARSGPKIITTLVQPPRDVNIMPTSKSTARVTWAAVNNVLMYQVTISDNDDSSIALVVRKTSATTMEITDLQPCSNYVVGVSSVNNFLEAGEPAHFSHTTSIINKVSSISVNYDCTASTVTVTWGAVFGANSYKATVIDVTAAELNCTSASTSCTISSLKCGERYLVHVTAISDDCQSISNTSTFFDTVPCAPANVSAFRECASNVVVFSWEATHNTIHYLAKSVSSDGVEVKCRTTETSCYFTDTRCGLSYNYTVYAISTECNSEVSPPTIVRASPCRPENVLTLSDCQSDNLTTSWDVAAGAESYLVEVYGNNGDKYHCTNTSNSCVVAGVSCGEHLSVWVTAIAGECANRVLGQAAVTAPCSPNVSTVAVDCNPHSAIVNWTSSNGAVFYIATAQHANGMVHSCMSFQTNCIIDGLDCGQSYNGTVVATNLKCNSTITEHVEFTTGPCAPSHVQAVANCTSNNVDISWEHHQPTGSYTAVIQDHNSSQLSCTSDTLNTCEILTVPCGTTYDVTVTYSDGVCSPASTLINLNSVLCAPENVSASLTCPNTAHVTWVGTATASSYNVTAVGEDGHIHYCPTNSTSCQILNMHCGQNYTITVTPYADLCAGNPSIPQHLIAGPCPPSNVSVSTECGGSTVSWFPVSGADMYIATATAHDGHNHTCNSSSANSCSFTDLHCGETYSVSVVAVDRGCHSEPSPAVEFETVPCVPTNVQVYLDSINTAVVSWSASKGAVQYSVSAWSSQGYSIHQSSELNCTVKNITCGSNYTVDIKAINGNCSSNPSQALVFSSAPCPPQNVRSWVNCSSDTLVISWDPNADDLNYTALATGDGRVLSCTSCNNTCSIEDLPCGYTFSLQVMAHTEYCDSQLSLPVNTSSAPSQPQGISGFLDCMTDTATISWDSALGAEMYTVTAVGGDHTTNCTTSTSTTCMVDDLACGVLYTFCVCAANGLCDSRPSTAIQLQTAPCQPVNLSVEYNCASMSALLSWTPATDDDVEYFGCAQDDSDNMVCCDSLDTNCTIEGLQCGVHYNFTVLASDGTCNSSVSDTVRIGAGPCPPDSVQVRLMPQQLQRQVLRFSWTEVPCSDVQYLLTVTGSLLGDNQTLFDLLSPSTTSTAYEMPLPCGSSFLASVGSSNYGGNSGPSRTISGITAPCSPAGVTYNGDISSATVSWNASVHAVTYMVYNDSVPPKSLLCSTGSLTCSVTNIQSSHLVVTASNEGGESGGTHVTSGGRRRRRRSFSLNK